MTMDSLNHKDREKARRQKYTSWELLNCNFVQIVSRCSWRICTIIHFQIFILWMHFCSIFCPLLQQQLHNHLMTPKWYYLECSPIFSCLHIHISSSSFTITSWPLYDAAWSAVPYHPACTFTSASFSSSSFTITSWPPHDAAWSAVLNEYLIYY